MLAQHLEKTRDNLGKKTREYFALRAKVGKPEKEQTTMCDASKAIEEMVQRLELRVALNAKTMTRLATLVTDH